ncbi:hypothetical protein [Anatilimnocola floriformis]|uniref:hypothetical protein n=1 Tax=Anatilimnocola floriformis TaxID=2948575 RepID=UPI0020C1DDB2|nr:hypothetical protein [Anatilimnocola floriformis]
MNCLSKEQQQELWLLALSVARRNEYEKSYDAKNRPIIIYRPKRIDGEVLPEVQQDRASGSQPQQEDNQLPETISSPHAEGEPDQACE